jgi:hypothetical protein
LKEVSARQRAGRRSPSWSLSGSASSSLGIGETSPGVAITKLFAPSLVHGDFALSDPSEELLLFIPSVLKKRERKREKKKAMGLGVQLSR